MKKKTFLLFFLLSTLLAFSQQRKFSHIGLPEGLPQETVLAMTVDMQGMVWLGTSDGLVRYDGSQFHIPLVDDKTKLDIAGYRIGAVATHQEYVLAGTGQKGLMAYHIVNETTTALGDDSLNCTAIAPVTTGFVAGYFNGTISYFNEEHKETTLTISGIVPNRINTIAWFKNTLYVGTDDGKLLQASWQPGLKTLTFQQLPIQTTKVNFIKPIENILYVGTEQHLYTVTPNEHPTVMTIPFCNTPIPPVNATDIVTSKGHTFLATTSGLYEWKEQGCATQYTSAEKNNPFHLNTNAINKLLVAGETLFIGHITLDLTEVEPPTVFKLPTSLWQLNNPSVFAVHQTNTHLLVGSSSGLIIADANEPATYQLFPQFRLRGITEDQQQNIWFVTGNGATVIPKDEIGKQNPNFITIPVSENDTSQLSSKNLRNVFTDNSGAVWITTFSKGLCKFEGTIENNNFKFQRFAFGKEASKLPSPLTLSMVQDTEGTYWIATQKGLSSLQIDKTGNQLFKTYTEADGLATNGVLSSFIAENGTLWVASRKGLNKYLPEEDRFEFYGKRDGLTNTFVYNITEDNDNQLWLTTNGGLFRFNPTTEHFANYLPKDGVQSTEFNLGAIFKHTSSGILYAGGIAGLTQFDPKRVSDLDQPAPLIFSNMTSKGAPVKAINTRSPIVFKYDDFPITLSYSALDYRPSKNNSYEYRLLPQDEQWNALPNNQDIQFLNLSPGTYTIELRGLSRGIAWQQKPIKLALRVSPPWYRSTWAFIGYTLLLGSILFFYYKISLQKKLAAEEARRLQDLDDLKTRFITNITHEFRTPLTIILGYIDRLKETNGLNTAAKSQELEVIENNSTNLLHLVNQMLDLAKIEKGRLQIAYQNADIATYVASIVSSFEHAAEEKNSTLYFKNSIQDASIDFDAEKIRQILSNLLSNALKFTDKGSISVTLSEENNYYSISVKDTGHGIPEADLPHIFERFYQVENNTFKVSQGTGVGLALTNELVHLMGGTIDVASKKGLGTTFKVTLPLTRNAEKATSLKHVSTTSEGIDVPYTPPKNANLETMVLVVEDNPDMSRYIGSCLDNHYKVLYAPNGQEGLATATEVVPDIIVSDVMMPLLDGFEMTQRLQKQESTNHIPVILLTSKAAQEDKIEGLYSGADAYLTKPFQRKELLLRMAKLIEKRQLLQQKYQQQSFTEVIQQHNKSKDKNELFLEKAVAIIGSHLEDASFGSLQLSKELALSESQLYRKLKAITDTSTALFIRSIRLEKAKELLESSSKNVSEIAYETGFNDPNWFSKTFKEKFGVSPSEIQKT